MILPPSSTRPRSSSSPVWPRPVQPGTKCKPASSCPPSSIDWRELGPWAMSGHHKRPDLPTTLARSTTGPLFFFKQFKKKFDNFFTPLFTRVFFSYLWPSSVAGHGRMRRRASDKRTKARIQGEGPLQWRSCSFGWSFTSSEEMWVLNEDWGCVWSKSQKFTICYLLLKNCNMFLFNARKVKSLEMIMLDALVSRIFKNVHVPLENIFLLHFRLSYRLIYYWTSLILF